MAKDDKGGDDYEFEVPDFDEDAFIHKELVSFKTTGILFGWGVLSALISWGLWEATGSTKTGWYIGLVVMVVFGYLLRYVYRFLKVDIDHFGRREWFGTFFLLFFAWLSFFILFVNPPISDHADPTAAFFASPSIQQEGGDVMLDLFAADNYRVGDVTFELSKGATVIATQDDLTELSTGHWEYALPNAGTGLYTYAYTVEDTRGNVATVEGDFRVSSRAMRVNIPDDGRLDSPGEEVIVTVDGLGPCTAKENRDGGDCLRTVILDLDNGNLIWMEYDDVLGGWMASLNFAGWTEGENTFSVIAETQNQFQGQHVIENGELRLNGPYNVTVDGIVGDYVTDVASPVTVPPITRQTPGFEVVVIVGVLAAFAVLARRRQA